MDTMFNFRFSILGGLAPKWIVRAIAAAAAFALPVAAQAQGCAMCYTSASAAKKAGMEALQNGVFILFFPPLLIFAAILWQTFHRRSAQEAVETEPSLASQPLELKPLE
jgi:hypothetical protein